MKSRKKKILKSGGFFESTGVPIDTLKHFTEQIQKNADALRVKLEEVNNTITIVQSDIEKQKQNILKLTSQKKEIEERINQNNSIILQTASIEKVIVPKESREESPEELVSNTAATSGGWFGFGGGLKKKSKKIKSGKLRIRY